ncbi:hypothetical protein [Bradyrhizobium jicamae]|uniref:hypothetical protein n=1 Tax=Bradyrhizobium jicamae TaxID=280332 RepID=UPI002012D493|nr:hypothetical protein [Bradyrhizobium jicamae]
MQKFDQIAATDSHLLEEAQRLRKEARGTPPGVQRDDLIRKARLAENAARLGFRAVSPVPKSAR